MTAVVAAAASASAKPPPTADRRILATLIATMREDARRQALARPGAVTVQSGCCGTRTVRIHHAAHPEAHVLVDSYMLRIKSKGRVVLGLAVTEVVNEAAHTTSGFVHREAKLEYELERAPKPGARWHGLVTEDETETTAGNPGQPSFGVGASKTCSPPRLSAPIYAEMLDIVVNAQAHISSLRHGHFGVCS